MEWTIKSFLVSLPYAFIPLLNIGIITATIVYMIEDWLVNNDNWQNFLNKKL